MKASEFEQELRELHNQLSGLKEIKDERKTAIKSWQPLYTVVGKEIRRRRLKMGLNQTEAARLLKLGRTSLNNIEHGRSRFPLDKLYFIAALLGCTVHELLPNDLPEMF
jgi:DNA-binding XRE family transcriptional regulator